MVRETRHLWVGNLPENIREDRILEHFKRYGKVQSVKILPRNDDDPSSGVSATVAFIDIKSAAKAHNGEHKIEERTLKTDYYEPPASSTASSAIYIHERDDSLARSGAPTYTGTRPSRYPHGVPEDRNYERPGHYYDRVVERETYLRRPMGYHDDDGYQSRGRPRDRYNRVNAATAAYPDGLERNQSHFRTHGTRQHFDLQRYPCADQYAEEREGVASAGRLVRRPNSTTSGVSSTVSSPPQQRTTGHHKKQKRKSPSRSHSGSRSNSPSRSRSSSRSTGISRSSSSSSKLRSSSSDSSSRSRSPSKSRSPAASYGSQGSRKGGRSDRPASTIAAPPTSGSFLPSTVATPATTSVTASSQGSSQSQSGCSASSDNCNDKEDKRPRAICVRNLPVRSTDTSLKDGLFHEYKKHGKVTMVKVIGQGTDRYAVVCFKKPDDVEKALEVSRDKLFFGCKIEVTAHEGLDGEDNDFRPLEAELDEYHPKATRTLFIGNLEKDIMTSELRKHFEAFGEIIEIDIKKQATASSYAFIQYSDIASVVKAMRKLDGENLGANRIKLGFGKSMPTNCVWMDGIVDTITEKALVWHFHRFGPVGHIAIDREKGHALVFYDSLDSAQIAVSEMRGRILGGKRLQVDFASRECQIAFFEKMEMTGQLMPGERPWERRERRADFEVLREERDTRAGFDSYGRNYNRYDGQQRAARGTFRGIQRTGFNNRGRGQGFTGRNFEEEFSQGSGASIEDSYEQELREYGYCQRERRDFGSDEHSVRGKSFSPVRRKDIGSISPPQREKHGDDRSSSPHSRSSIHGGDKHDYHHLRDRFSSREDGIEDGSGYEDKPDRTKSLEISEKLGKKKGKHRSSVSDQESHHSQSPPHSRHQSRSRSPPVKDKRPLKDRERLHGRARSPGSRSSSHVGSPTRDISMDFEMFADKEGTSDAKESVRRKSSLSKQEAKDAVLPVLCPKPEPLQDVCEKSRVRGNLEALKRRLQDCDLSECSPSIELSSPTERKRRLLEVSDHVTSKDVLAQLRTESEHLVRRNSVIPTLLSVKSEVVSSESAANDDGKSDTESGELLEEAHVEKPRAESANDLKTLEKEHLQLLQLLEQLGEGATSSDTEGSGELDEPSKKKAKSLRLLQHNVVKGLHASLPGKNECQDSAVFTSKVGEMEDGVDVCVMPKGMDSLLSSRKPMDPRKSLDQVNASSVASHHRLKRFISEKDILRLNNERTDTELLGSSPSSIGIPHRTKSSFGSIQRVSLLDGDSASCVDEGGADNSVKDDHSAEEVSSSGESVTHRKLSRSNLSSLELSRQSSLSLRVSGSSSSENKKEKEMCPLSLPLPEFAASLRSPKVVLNPLLSPKANSLSPRGGHSPSACLTSKSPYHSLSEAGKLEKIASHCVENKATTTVCTVSQASDSKSSPALPLTISSPLMSPKSPKKSNEVESSSDSECSALSSPNCPSIEERIRALDEKFNAWSGSTRCISTSLSSESTPPTPTIDYQKYNIKKRPRFLPEFRTEPSDIVKSLLAKSSIFDQDSKRLEHINEKYEPKEVNIDLSPKAKPFFRTKAAAKEFATPIPSLTSLNHTSGANRFSMFYSTSTASVTTPPSLTSSQTSTPAVPSPVPSHLTSVSLSNQSSTHYLSSHSSSILTSSSPSIITSTSKMATDLNALNQQKPATTQPAFNTSSTLRKTVDLNSKTVPPCIRKEPSATNVACPSSVSSVKTGSISASSSSLQHQCGSNGTGGGGAGSGSGGGGVTVSSTMAKKESIPVVKDTSALSSSSVCVKKESNKDSVSRKDSVSSSSVKDIPQKKECSSTSSSSSSVSKNASSKRETVPKDLHKDSLAIKDVKRESAHAVGNKEQFMAKKDSVAATFGKEKQPVSCVATLSKDNKHDVMQATGAKEQFVSKKEASNLNSAIKDVPKSECASDIVGPSTKRRVPSIDSESDSGKSSDVRIESRDNQWQTVEVKSENKTSMDSEHKKSKPNQSNNSRDVEKGEEKSSSPQPHTPKKSEKKDKNSRSSDKSSKSNISRSDSKVNLDRRDDQDSRGSEGKASSESKEKSRSECPKSKDDKKLKSKDNKGSGKNDWRNRSKSTESNRSSEKLDKKSTHSNNKSKREHATEKIEKQSERKQPSNETTKHDSGSSKPRRRRSEAKLSFSEEEPVYFSMYDKVKARSSQNQSLKEAKDLESVRQKFSQLKRSRAKREEKAKSHEMETDDDSDSASHMSEDKDAPSKIRTTPKSKQSKKRKLVIESSSDNEESCPPTTIADFQSKEERGGDVSSDAGFDSDAASHPGPLSLQLMSPTYNTSKARSKCKELSDDSPSSDDLSQLISSVNKKSKSSPGATEPDIKPAKCLKSDNESSDNEQVIRMPKKKKDGGKKKLKKEKYIERLLESDASDVEIFRKTEDHKSKKNVIKEEKHTPETNYNEIYHTSTKERKLSGSSNSKSATSTKNDTENNEHEAKPKTPSKKKKKSKKSKAKEKKPSGEKTESKSDIPKVVETKEPSPKLAASPPKEVSTPALPSLPILNMFSDNEFNKSDFSDIEIETEKPILAEAEQDPLQWMCTDNKQDSESENKLLDNIKSEPPEIVQNATTEQEKMDPLPSTNLQPMLEKIDSGSSHNSATSQSGECSAELESSRIEVAESLVTAENVIVDTPVKKHHQSHKKSSNDETKKESRSKSRGDEEHSKEEKHKKKNKKQSKEKKRKSKDDHKMDDLPPSLQEILEPTFHDKMPPLDEESRMSEDIRLDEDIAEQARRLEAELLAATEETSTFGDTEGPCRREEKVQERRFEEEAAKETRRLEEELMSTAREPWHMKETKPFDDDDALDQAAPPLDDNSEKEQKMTQEAVETLTLKENTLFCNLDGSSSVGISVADHDPTQDFLVDQDESDQFKLDEKDVGSYEVDNQRKIEDDLAVSALLQEMNCEESAPLLTKETDYLGPLLEPSAEEAISYLNNYLVEGPINESPNHISDMPQEEQTEEKMPPPLLEIPDPIIAPEAEAPHHLVPSEELKEVPEAMPECPQVQLTNHLPEETLLPGSTPETDDEPPLVSCERLMQPAELSQPLSPGNPPVLEMEMSVIKNETSRKHRKKRKKEKTMKPDVKELDKLKSFNTMKFFPEVVSLSELETYSDSNKEFHNLKSPSKKADCSEALSYSEPLQIPDVKVEHSDDNNMMKINEIPEIKDLVIDQNPPSEKELEKLEDVLQFKDIMNIHQESAVPGTPEKIEAAAVAEETQEKESPAEDTSGYLPDSIKFSVIKSTAEEHPENMESEALLENEEPPLKMDKEEEEPKEDEPTTSELPLPHASKISEEEVCNNFPVSIPEMFPENELDSEPPAIPEFLSESKLSDNLPPVQLESPFPLERIAEPPDMSESHRLLESDCSGLLSDSLCSEERKDNGSDHTEDSDKTEIVDDSEYQPGVGDLAEDGDKEGVLSFEDDAREAELDTEREIISSEAVVPEEEEEEEEESVVNTAEQPLQEMATLPSEPKVPIVPSEAEGEDEAAPLIEHDDRKKHHRSRRGRRAKTRKFSEPSATMPKYECDADVLPTMTQLRSSKRGRTSVVEKTKRNLRSQMLDISIPLEPVDLAAHIECVQASETNEGNTTAIDTTESSLQASEETIAKNTANGSPTMDEDTSKEVCEETDNKTEDSHQISEQQYESTEIKPEELRKRKGRKKKGSGESHCGIDKVDIKRDEGDTKEVHRQRLLLPLSSSERCLDQKATRGNSSLYDVFEFREEDEDLAFNREMPSAVRNLDPPRSSGHIHDHRHHESKHSESLHEREKRHDDSKHKSSHHDDRDISGKEYVTELSQHGKISITIRLHQKDSHDGSFSSTAEVVKTSEAVSAEEPKIDSTRSEKTSKADNSSSDASGTNTVKPTRKSARLMSQAPKTTVDEVIEDVVKGNFKGLDSEGAAESVPVRPTRRTRANRRSEEALARQQEDSVIEPAFASTDTNQKTKYDALPSSDKSKDQFLEKAGSLSSPPAAVSEVNNPGDGELKSESRMSLRSFRFTRSAARNEASKESAGCSSSSTLPEQVPEKNDTSGLAQNSVPTRKDHESLKSPPPTSSEESNAQQQHAECGQSRTTLPVLKVELPRMSVSVLAQVHSITMGESVKTKETKGNVNQKQSENDDEGDSRSSPTALIDPVTGFLTPVTKKDPPADKQPPSVSSDQAKETQENVQAAAPTPPPSLPQVSIPSVSEPCSSPPVTSITETMTTSNSTPSTYVPPRTSTEHISHTSLLSPSSQLVVQSPTNPPSTSSETVVSSAPEHCLSTISSSSSVSSTSVVVPPQSSTPQSIVQNEPSQTSVATSTSEPSKLPSCIQSASSSVVHSTLALHSAATTKAGASVCLTTTSTTPTTSITTSHVSLPSAIPQAHSPVGQPQVSLCHPMPAWPQTPPTSSAQLAAFHPYVPPAVRGIPGSSSGLKLSKPYATASIHSPSPVIQQSLAKTVAPTVVVSSAQGVNITPAEINPKRLSAPHLSASVTLPSVKSEVVGPECLTSTAQSVSRSPNIMTSCKVESTQVTSSSTPLPLIPPAHSRTESSSPRIATSQGNLGHSAGTSPATASRHLSTVITTQTGVLSHANAATTMAPSHGIGKHEISQVSQSGSGGSSKQSHAHSSKHSPNFMHQSPFPTGAFEAAVHSASRGLTPPTSTNSGVIAELLQNPHLLQHKEYLAAAAQHTASSSSQFTERMPSQMVRPSLTSALHADMATRLGNPTPPHTPTPPVTSATHSLQPPELHATHLAGIHLRHPAQPTLIVPPHHLGIHPNELTAYVHQQMMYAAAHPHYAALHPELRAQQEAQARAAAMGIPPRFAYPHIPPTASSTGFRQPLEPVVQHSVSSDSKLETKAHIENSKSAVDQRLLEERSKSSKIKQEVEKEAKSSQSELRMPEETESKRLQGVVDSRHASNRHVSSPLGSIRPPGLAYPTPIRQLRPHISLSPHERLTDSPAIAHPYAQGAQLRTAASQVPPRPEELKQEPMQRPQQVKSESTERDVKPPAAHKQPPTTMAFHTIDTVGLSHPLLGVPPVGSPAPGYLEGRPIHQSALVLKKEAAPSPVLVPPLHQAEPHEVHKKVSHGRLLQQQKEPALSPGLSAAHSPSPISNLVVSRASQQPLPTLGQPTAETNIRRANIHPIPQTGSEAPVHPPPPAHAMSQPGAPQGHPQTPPHASQVPPQGDSLLLQRYPVMWQGLLALKNDQAAVQMHFVSGNPRIARASLPPVTDGGTPPVRIAQRMRLEQTQLEGVARKMQMVDEHCILLALPCGRDHMDVLQQSNNLRNGFINYLQSKQAAGIVNAAAPGSQQAAYVIHIFPSCDFSNENMARIAPDLLHSVSDIAHLLIIIATV